MTAVLGRDRSTSEQRRANRLEKAFADMRGLRRADVRAIRAGDANQPVVEIDRHAVGHRNGAHPACLLQTVAKPEDGGARLSVHACRLRETNGCEPIGRKAEIGRSHPVEHHAADHEERDGDADLDHRGDTMHANRLTPAAPDLLLERANQIGAAVAKGRQQSEEHAHQQAQSRCGRDTDGIEIDFRRNRHADPPPDDNRGNTEQHEGAEGAGGKGQEHGFKEEMLNETPPAGAERRADAQLTLAAGAAHQHHARDVQAHDRQHRSSQPEQDGDHAGATRCGRPHPATSTARPSPL
jgi:hypothetical protein